MADPSDVVTCRIVTRDVGDGPKIFSRCLEVPLTPTASEGRDPYPDASGQYYLLMRIDEDGIVLDSALPEWLRLRRNEDASAQNMDRGAAGVAANAQAERERALVGRCVPDFEQLAQDCLDAHRLFPGLFAVAWDVAIAEGGIFFLEGNAGFGTLVPQWLSGGLLAEARQATLPGPIS